ncbi:NmrA/HSCARG family protein [Aspergillus mulundensis]|uniref:NmrA-like domain-containing protein n=1 Tax=Aspergillus mulundensis TaxID=1810919 RepID=A0A3D8RFD2_9EURO|nr:Uncharacterized protein DSM5745_07927 [Aspergillus mulundensis]RDW72755.1 Uncharacterized protein DSM5745_07927 [Aspergillus mulundensis]
MAKKTIVVVGATGQQGGSVITAIRASPTLSKQYTIKGTTRDLTKPAAQDLIKKGIEIVPADINDPSSLRAAFSGASIVFANSITIYDGHTLKHEIQQGRAMADAAVAAGVPAIIYSTLPHAGNISNGELKAMGHFDGKAEVEAYIRTLPIRSAFVAPGSFMSNFFDSMAPRPDYTEEGAYVIAMPVPAETKLPLIDTAGDLGKWVAAILEDFDQFEGKVLCCATRLYSFSEIVEILSRLSGKKIVYRQVPVDVWKGFLPPLMAEHIADMIRFFYEFGYFGEDTEGKVAWSAEMAGVDGRLTTLEEFIGRNPLKL